MSKPTGRLAAVLLAVFFFLSGGVAPEAQAQVITNTVVSSSELTVDEGATVTYTLRLTGAPAGTLTITPSITPVGHDLTLSPLALTFTTGNWNSDQTVTVTAAEDDSDSGNDTATIRYDVLVTFERTTLLTVTVTDNDDGPTFGSQVADQNYTEGTAIPTLTLPAATGGAGATTYTLTGFPDTSAVGLPDLGLTFSASDRTLTGTPAAAAAAGFTLTYTATDDNMISASQTFDVRVRTLVTVGFENPRYTVSEDAGQFASCVLVTRPTNSQPLQGVGPAVPISIGIDLSVSTRIESTDTITAGEFTAITNQLVDLNNNQRRACISVDVADDSVVDGDKTFTLSVGFPPPPDLLRTAREAYFAITIDPDTAVVTVEDDDLPPGVSLSTGTLSVDEGAAGTYTLQLDALPTGDVTVTPGSGDTGVATVSGALTFTSSTWNTAQTVTVTGVVDGDAADDTVTVSHTVTGAAEYSSLTGVPEAVVTVPDTQSAPDLSGVTVADQFFPLGGTLGGTGNLQALTLPPAAGGDAPVTYALQPTIAGLTFDATSRVLSGTPSAATAAPVTMTYTATDTDGQSDSLTYSVSVQEVTIGFERATYLEREDAGGIQVCVDMTVPATGTALPQGGVAQVSLASTIRTSDTAEASDFTAVSESFMFDDDNRDGCAIVRITQDSVREDSESFALTLTLDAPRSNFDVSLDPGTATVTIEDDDAIEVRLRAAAYPAMEGATLTFTVEISNPPASEEIERGDFSVAVSTMDGTAAAGMDFTAISNLAVSLGDSRRSRDIEVTITDDTAEEVDETFTLQLGFVAGQQSPPRINFVTPQSATVTIEANDVPGVTFAPTTLVVVEGRNNTYTLVLDAEPSASAGEVIVTPSSGDTATATVSGALTFTAADWDTPQTVTVAGAFDFDLTDDTVTMSHTVTGSGNYASLTAGNVMVTIDDVGTGVTFTPSDVVVVEGANNTYTLVLDAEPSAGNVVVTPRSGDLAVATVSGALTFTPANWDTPQTVTVAGLFDFDLNDDTVTMSHAVAGGGNFAGLTVGHVMVTIDDVGTGVTFAPSDVVVVEGANNTYTAVLDARPSAGNVVVTPRSGDAAVATVSGALTFTAANWNVPQAVTVTGTSDDDAVDDTVTMNHAVSGNGNFAGLTVGNVVVRVDDDETPGITVAPAALTLIEGASAHYALWLDSEPENRGTVTVTPSSNNRGVATLSPAGALMFGPDNWRVAQTVTVTGIDDRDDDSSHAVISHVAAGADYDGVGAEVRVTVDERVDDELQALNETILPEVARAVVVQQLDAIAERAGLAGTPGARHGFNLNGQSSFAGVAATNAEALAGGDLDLKQTLRDLDFVMPLAAGGGSGATGGMAFWGGSEYRDFSGEDGATEWDGDLFSMHLGFDARVRANLLTGLMLSYSDSESDYAYVEDGRTKKGDYELDLTSVHPYLNWDTPGGGRLWVTAGYGEGELEITPDDADIRAETSDMNLRTVGAGGSRRLLDEGDGHELHVKADAFFTRAEIDDGDGADSNVAGLEVDASRLRVALEWRHPRTLSGGTRLVPGFELGVRHDGGDGQTGSGMEVGGSVNYRHVGLGLTLEGRARALVGHSGGHRGWGIGGLVRMDAGLDEQGLSVSLRPGYGDISDGVTPLWDNGVRGRSADEEDMEARLEARVGYGLSVGRGLLAADRGSRVTPYGALSLGEDKRKYRLGAQWGSSGRFGLDLFAERTDGKAPDGAIVLEGKLKF